MDMKHRYLCAAVEKLSGLDRGSRHTGLYFTLVIATPKKEHKKTRKPLINKGLRVFSFWRRRRDSNPRDPFEAYTISNRVRSTKLRDFSTWSALLNQAIFSLPFDRQR